MVTRRGTMDNRGSLSSSSSRASSSSSGCGYKLPQHGVALLHTPRQVENHSIEINLASGLWNVGLASDRSSDSSIHVGAIANSGIISLGDLVGLLAGILGHCLPTVQFSG
jgi:hypothetical protein